MSFHSASFFLDGRINRKQFLIGCILIFLLCILIYGLAVGDRAPPVVALMLIFFGVCAPLILCVKRFHDCGASGWWVILCLIPYANVVPLLYLLFWRGTIGANRFGQDTVTFSDI